MVLLYHFAVYLCFIYEKLSFVAVFFISSDLAAQKIERSIVVQEVYFSDI